MEEMTQKTFQKPLLRVLKEMGVGEVLTFPIEKKPTIRAYCNELKQVARLQFTTRSLNKEGVMEVQRVS